MEPQNPNEEPQVPAEEEEKKGGEKKDDETQLPEDNEIAEENMHNNTAKDGDGAEDPNAPRIEEDK